MKKFASFLLALMGVAIVSFVSCKVDAAPVAPGFNPKIVNRQDESINQVDYTSEGVLFVQEKNYLKDVVITGLYVNSDNGNEIPLTYEVCDNDVRDRLKKIRITIKSIPTEIQAEDIYDCSLWLKKGENGNQIEIPFKFAVKSSNSTEPVIPTPQITVQPSSADYILGSVPSSLSVTATISDGSALAYQWYKDGVAIPGETNATYTPSVIQEGSETYYVIVMREDGKKQVTSSNAVITVTAKDGVAVPTILVGATDSTIGYNSVSEIKPISITVSAISGAVVKGQWYKGSAIVGTEVEATEGKLEYTPTSYDSYYCEVWAEKDGKKSQNKTSGVFTVKENEMIITTSGLSSSGYVGEELSVSVSVNVSPVTITYQWYTTNASSSNDVEITGATSATYTPTEEGNYKCGVTVTSVTTGKSKPVTNSGTCVVVEKPANAAETPNITLQPTASVTVNEGETITFSVEANVTDGGTLTYQWYKNNLPINGATNATYTKENATKDDEGLYKVKVTNTLKGQTTSKDSTSANVTVNITVVLPENPVITTQPANVTVNEGETITLSVVANVSDSGTLSYQWYKGTAVISGATSATYTILSAAITDSGEYKVVVTNMLNDNTSSPVTSTTATVTVNAVVTDGNVGGSFDFN